MRKISLALFALVLVASSVWTAMSPAPAQAADYSNSHLMDDSVFDNANSMNASQIQSFLASKGPCLASYSDTNFSWNGSSWVYSGSISAAQAIYQAAQDWGINPQVIIATLQKEESLISGTSCDGWRYASAMGYACPDSGGCNSKYAGFSKQVLWGSWQLKFNEQRSEGNLGWDGDNDLSYSGYMTQGTFVRNQGDPATYYDGNATIDGQLIHLDTGSTASLYTYTPHLNQSFPGIFESWFGSVLGYCTGSNIPGAASGEKILPWKTGNGPNTLAMTIMNQTGTGCIEEHRWTSVTGQQWALHSATNSPTADPANSAIISADTTGSGQDQLYKVDYQNTSSGMIEIHGWCGDLIHWCSHIATNRPAINPADAEVIAADLTGSGRDQFYLVQFQNTSSGLIEVHGWCPGEQQWCSHIATNRPAINPADATIIVANHQLTLVQYRNTSSGLIEVHGWCPGEQQWCSHIATNRPAIDPATAEVVALDGRGIGNDQLYLVQYSGTSSGMIEVHGWVSGEQQWFLHAATNQPSL